VGTVLSVTFTVIDSNPGRAAFAPSIQIATHTIEPAEGMRAPVYSQPGRNLDLGNQERDLGNPDGVLDLKIIPNPVSGSEMRLEFATSVTGPMQLSIFDPTGRTAYRRSFPDEGERDAMLLNLSDARLASGIYLLRLQLADGTVLTRKFVRM
jgi:hypothetical protein